MTSSLAASLDAHRDRIVARLTDHFGTDHLDLEDLERRLERVQDATTPEELDALIADLPADHPAEAPQPEPSTAITVTSEVPAEGKTWAIMGETTKKGGWLAPRHLRAVAVMGNVHLDFREAVLGPGVTEVSVFAMMGSIEITVPPDLRVQCEGIGILGSVEDKSKGTSNKEGPVLRITGVALMGSVEIKTRRVGETGWGAFKRALFGESKGPKALQAPK